MQGTLILVSGISGAGKTTLIAEALKWLNNLEYLKTYTTRPRRQGEEVSHEYVFVNEATYQQLQGKSPEWDHTEYNGFWYGADVAAAKKLLTANTNIICSVAPDKEVIAQMTRLYGARVVTVWIDTPAAVALARIGADAARRSRHEDATLSAAFTHIFKPTGNLRQDVAAFVELLALIMKQ